MRPGPILCLLLSVVLLPACGKQGGQQQRQRGPVEVGVVTLEPQSASLTTELPGRVVAYRVAQVRPQVSGIIQRRLFREGAKVEAGQALYQIEPGTYRAASDSAKAAVAKAEANALTARLRYERYLKLAESGVVSQQDRDDVTANMQQAQADLATAKAALESASINLAYTRISAPIAGTIAISKVTEGALVTANQATELTTIQQLHPIYIDLTQSSAELTRFRQQLLEGDVKNTAGIGASIKLTLENGTEYPLPARLEFTGDTVSESTGAISLRAVVANPNGVLLPGMYVRAVIPQGVDEKAILAPQTAVSRNDRGEPTAMVVGKDGKVEQRVLQTSNVVGTSWLVTDGLKAGDQLIVEGVQKVRSGDAVKVVPAGSLVSSGPSAGESRGGGGLAAGDSRRGAGPAAAAPTTSR